MEPEVPREGEEGGFQKELVHRMPPEIRLLLSGGWGAVRGRVHKSANRHLLTAGPHVAEEHWCVQTVAAWLS